MSRTTDSLLALIDDVYGMAAGSQPWSALAPRMAETFDAPSGQVSLRTDQHFERLAMTANIAARSAAYDEHFWRQDIWVKRAAECVGMSQVVTSADLVSEAEFMSLEFYQDWCRSIGIFHLVGAVFPTGLNAVGVVGIHRDRASAPFDATDCRRLGQFLPHLERAVHLHGTLIRLQTHERLAATALERGHLGLLLVSSLGTIRYVNAVAEDVLRRAAGLKSRAGKLCATDPEDHRKLVRLMASACDTNDSLPRGEAWMGLRTEGQVSASVFVTPFRAVWNGRAGTHAMVFVRELRRRIRIAEAARQVFGLTPAEARIAEGLVNGATVESLARRHGTSPQTVRKQLNGLMHRVGVTRQADCVAVLLRTLSPVGAEGPYDAQTPPSL